MRESVNGEEKSGPLTQQRVWRNPPRSQSFLSKWQPLVGQVYRACKSVPSIFVRLIRAEMLFLLWSSWQRVQKYTEETTKLRRPPLPKRYLLIYTCSFWKLHIWTRARAAAEGGSVRKNTTVSWGRWDWVGPSGGCWVAVGRWQWTGDLMLRQTMNLFHHLPQVHWENLCPFLMKLIIHRWVGERKRSWTWWPANSVKEWKYLDKNETTTMNLNTCWFPFKNPFLSLSPTWKLRTIFYWWVGCLPVQNRDLKVFLSSYFEERGKIHIFELCK